MRRVEGGFLSSFAAGRIGRGTRFPPQFGQTPPSLFSTQSRQKVHSNVHIIASLAEGGKSLSQHSQLGRNSSICSPRVRYIVNLTRSSPAAPQLRAVLCLIFRDSALVTAAAGAWQMCKGLIWKSSTSWSANSSEHDAIDLASIKLRRGLAKAACDPR